MKFPRSARIFRGQTDVIPYASVLFLLALFLLLGTLVYTPGVKLSLPVADDLPGTDKPSVNVAVDALGRLYYDNQIVTDDVLKNRLRVVVREAGQPLTLVIHADKSVAYENLLGLTVLARDVGIRDALLATLPRANVAPAAQ